MSGFRLITSAAYLGQELSAEFGTIPPAFLPVGNMRLYEAQIARLGSDRPIYLTIPETYVPQAYDLDRLDALGVTLLRIPEGLRLGESIVYSINFIDRPSGPVQVLHGDTLIEDLPLGADNAIAVHEEGDDYAWAAVTVRDGWVEALESKVGGTGRDVSQPVACGYFSCASSSLLVRAATSSKG